MTDGKITLSKRHVQAILDFPPPTNLRELRGFLGLSNYFRRFIKDYAEKTKCLQELLKKDIAFDFNENCIKAFENLRKELASPPVLCVYNPTAITELHTDASSHGFGAILLQRQLEGHFSPVAYFSKSTNEAEKNYYSFELETLAIVKAIERFHVYLHGIKFKIVTDCNSLVMAMKKININPRIARWSLVMQNYKFELTHHSSSKMVHVDCLSRNVMIVQNISFEDELMYKQLSDPKLEALATELETKENKHFSLLNGLLFKNYCDKQLFVIPESMVENVIRVNHDEMGHVGIDKTIHGVLNHYWFPCMKIRVKQHIENCVKCLSYSIASGKMEGELEIVEIKDLPMHTIHVDHFGPLEETKNGYKYILVAVDAYTKYIWLFPCRSATTNQVIIHLNNLVNFFGCPERIKLVIVEQLFRLKFLPTLLKITDVMTAVASPWANGQVERVNRFLKSTMSKLVNETDSWDDILGKTQYVLNNTWHKSINMYYSE